MVPSLSWVAQPNRPHHNIRQGATRRCLSASFPTYPPIRLRRRPLNSPWLSLVGQGSACKAPCTLCFFLEAVHNVLSASGAILQRVIAQCHAVHDCCKPSLCHKFATLSLQKPALQSKTAHHTAKCNVPLSISWHEIKHKVAKNYRTHDHKQPEKRPTDASSSRPRPPGKHILAKQHEIKQFVTKKISWNRRHFLLHPPAAYQ